jgi:hypothetical protein
MKLIAWYAKPKRACFRTTRRLGSEKLPLLQRLRRNLRHYLGLAQIGS